MSENLIRNQQLKTCHHRTVDTPTILTHLGRCRNIIKDQTLTDPRNQISISRETNPVLTPSWKKIDETISNRGNPTPIDNTHLKNTATRVKDSVLFFHQQRRCAHRLQELRAPTQPSQIPGEYHTEYSDPG